ncbi:MAG TPA: SAM-dependent methyltransferase, partial [Bacteroidales bacterium]|nr:SAM-dependent methyltransferase [Bacteroidales bacterium]
MKGKLYMLPVNLSEADLQWAIPENVLKQTIGLKVFIVENIRTARRFLKKADRTIDIDQL